MISYLLKKAGIKKIVKCKNRLKFKKVAELEMGAKNITCLYLKL